MSIIHVNPLGIINESLFISRHCNLAVNITGMNVSLFEKVGNMKINCKGIKF